MAAVNLPGRTLVPWLVLVAALAGAAGVASCGSDGARDEDRGGDVDPSSLAITPEDDTLALDPEAEPPTVNYRVTVGGAPADATWEVDRLDLATIDADGALTPTGQGAGVITVTATVGDAEISTTLTIEIDTTQNGPGAETPGAEPGAGTPADYPFGPGGFMGVGGEGLGGAVTDEQAAALEGDPEGDPAMGLLYPYEGTVWPLGMLAPLLMWDATDASDADAVAITLSTAHFSYRGTFGRPAALPADAPFVRHPIPNDVWQMATRSAAGGTLTVSVVLARGGRAYGPITQTWTVASGELLGCVYYQSYFTELALNYDGALGPEPRFGAATLGIRPGGTAPVLVAGWTSEDHSGCRVCHSVAANGTRMVVQHGTGYAQSSTVDLQNGYTETDYPDATDGTLGWVGMTPDGAYGLGNGAPLPGDASTGESALYDMTTGEVVPTSGLGELVTRAGLPVFSHDGTRVAFNFWEGPGDADIGTGDGHKLVVMDFDVATFTFANPRLVHENAHRPGWPTFLPGGEGLVFQLELSGSTDGFDEGTVFATRAGATGELWWADVETASAAALDAANGEGHVPEGPGAHADDTIYNYEPSVSPVSSGGYAWVVFVSRRQYGNVITADPYASDPREVNLTTEYSPKKLWIAAIDLDAEPGTDPSHPAIYLPAQEIQASNSRGFWTADPCVYTGQM